MKEVATIAPLGHEPGLVAYECSKFASLTSVVFQASERITVGRRLHSVMTAEENIRHEETSNDRFAHRRAGPSTDYAEWS
jgi:hypothetical protein